MRNCRKRENKRKENKRDNEKKREYISQLANIKKYL